MQTQTSGRGRITLDWDKAHELLDVFDDYLKEIAKLGELPQDEEDQRQVKSAAIRQGKRRYFVDLRENTRGRFVKVCSVHKHLSVGRVGLGAHNVCKYGTSVT